jgi:hypothetical protein
MTCLEKNNKRIVDIYERTENRISSAAITYAKGLVMLMQTKKHCSAAMLNWSS